MSLQPVLSTTEVLQAAGGRSVPGTLTIVIRLPKLPTGRRGYGAFRTHMPFFNHHLEDLVGLAFRRVDIYAFAASVRVPVRVIVAIAVYYASSVTQYIMGREISIEAVNTPISGFFNVSHALTLKTSQGAISVQADLWSTGDHANTSLVVLNHEE
jgi:hypothetical protein